MKTHRRLLVLITVSGWFAAAATAQTLVTPMMGGGQVAADMVHIDLFFDAGANQLHAHVDDSYGTPELRPLPAGFTFDSEQPYGALEGKAYNSQYGWNVGGLFALPPGAAIWIELLESSPGLETYSGWGRLASYAPLFGTAGASRLWKWSGVMVHNTYAVLNPTTDRLFAEYRVYLGDATTGSRDDFINVGAATVRLEWVAVPIDNPMTFRFGATSLTNGAPLAFLNADQFTTNSEGVVNMSVTHSGSSATEYQCGVPMLVVPATAANGGPATNHALLGSRLELELVSLEGPPQAALSFREPGDLQPRLALTTGQASGTNRIRLSENSGAADADPYGFVQHGTFFVNQPGLYCLGFLLVDTSANGPGGVSLHRPSPVYCLYLQAGLTIAALNRNASSTTVLFAGEPAKDYYLEQASTLDPAASWETVAGPITGTNRLQRLTAPATTASKAFFRIVTH